MSGLAVQLVGECCAKGAGLGARAQLAAEWSVVTGLLTCGDVAKQPTDRLREGVFARIDQPVEALLSWNHGWRGEIDLDD
jgi:hypothetical protein